ncbi:hypothetical protein SUGI_0060010 [Cryptomeria japonica]|uniref:uncharacterized protein LOC131071763 n=1 Tax=Cryptomeria japonica TaxID=3369 RepID=UPI002408BBA0|nr:uncharacterized protein LOC131071763 [Cryptomeria japonica]GLJ07156.1 hypothetical protein SUGI_0060010 [Cryptomeria japonica]
MEKYWRLKDHNPGSVFSNKRVDRKHIRWKAPAPDWFKLNFDGACRGNLRVSGYGAIIINVEGDMILGTYDSLGWATNNEADIHVLIAGLSLCVKHGLSKIVIEGDSLIAINGLKKLQFQNRRLCKWNPCFTLLLNSIGVYEVMHTYREGNRVVDFLANLGVDSLNAEVIFDKASAPEIICVKVKSDLLRSNNVK